MFHRHMHSRSSFQAPRQALQSTTLRAKLLTRCPDLRDMRYNKQSPAQTLSADRAGSSEHNVACISTFDTHPCFPRLRRSQACKVSILRHSRPMLDGRHCAKTHLLRHHKRYMPAIRR